MRKNRIVKALLFAFPKTIPIFAGFWFLGFSYGVLMNVNGFSFVYPMLMSMTIFGGSLEFVAASMLLSTFAPLQTLLAALMIQARHLFYGISMLEKYKDTGWKKPYLIFGMCDESFSINYSTEIPDDIDKGWFMFFVTLLNRVYWVTGSTLGGIIGGLIKFNTYGLSFVMTAMFVVIFLDQWLKEKQHISSCVGLSASQQIITIGLCVIGTMATRFLPFLVFKSDKPVPKYIDYLGKALPASIFGMLVVYCMKDVSILGGSHGLPEFIAIAVVIILHLWRKNMLLSVAGGTVCYMLLVQFVF